MRSHNSPWPWQGKFPANEEYAKDIVTMTMKIGEEMVAGSLGALSKAITVPKSGKLLQTPKWIAEMGGMVKTILQLQWVCQTNPIPLILNTPLKPWFSSEIPHNWDYLEGMGLLMSRTGSSPGFTGAVEERRDRLHRCWLCLRTTGGWYVQVTLLKHHDDNCCSPFQEYYFIMWGCAVSIVTVNSYV